jgi:hypothetical protein
MAFGHIDGEASGVTEKSVSKAHVGADQYVSYLTVPCLHTSGIFLELLALGKTLKNIVDRRAIRMEVCNVPSDILVPRVTHHVELRLVGTENQAVWANPVQRYRTVVEEILEISLAVAKLFL